MIFTDPAVEAWLNPPAWFRYTMEAVFAVGVIVVGKLWLRLAFRRAEKLAAASEMQPPDEV
jgi:hypothetical protein